MARPLARMFIPLVLVLFAALSASGFSRRQTLRRHHSLGLESCDRPIINSGVLADCEAEYPEVGVELIEYSPTDIYQQLPLAIASGVGAPDISFIASAYLAQFVNFGGLADLTEQVQPYLDRISDFKWQDAMKDGRYYAMPWDIGPVVL